MLPGAALFLSLSLSAAPAEVPETWSELKAALPSDKARRATALLRFADNDQAAIADRLRAAREARAHPPRRALGFVVEARLLPVAGKAKARAQSLKSAAAAFARDGERARQEHLARVLQGDLALEQLQKLAARREKAALSPPAPLAPDEEKLEQEVKDALAAWSALEDPRQEAVARLALARLRSSVGDAAGSAAHLDAALARAAGRDGAAVRAEALRLKARLLEAQGQLEAAALSSLGADREAAIDVKRAASRHEPSPYLKSRASLELCRRARAQGIVCGRSEHKKFGSTLHYDFSREPRGPFNPDQNAEVLADYDTLLQECIRAAARARVPLTQTVIELEWVVGQDGRVQGYDLRPTRLRKTSYDQCLKEAFALFRYPPYTGEMQHVRLSFEVGGEL